MKDQRQRLVMMLILIFAFATLWLHLDVTFKNSSRMDASYELKNLEERLKSVPASYKVVGVESLYKISDEIKTIQKGSILVNRRWFEAAILINSMVVGLAALWLILNRKKDVLKENSATKVVANHTTQWDMAAKEIIQEIQNASSEINSFQPEINPQQTATHAASKAQLFDQNGIISANAKAISFQAQDMAREIQEIQAMLRNLSETLHQESQLTTHNRIEWNLLSTQLRSSKETLLKITNNCVELDKKLSGFAKIIQNNTNEEKMLLDRSFQSKNSIINLTKNLNQLQSSSKDINHILESCRTDLKHSFEPIVALSSRAKEIAAIIGTIDDISEQTNLLAINASIEASRAGEQGQGFAVVAEEVRKLALKSSHATRNISELLLSIQTEAHQAEERLKNARASADVTSEKLNIFNQQISPSLDLAERASSDSQKIEEHLTKWTKSSATTRALFNDAHRISHDVAHQVSQFTGTDMPIFDKVNDLSLATDRVSRSLLRHSFEIEKIDATLEGPKNAARSITDKGQNLVISIKTSSTQDPALIDTTPRNADPYAVITAARNLSVSASSLINFGFKKSSDIKSEEEIRLIG